MIWHPVIVFFVLGVIASFAAFCGYCAGELDRLSRERGEGERPYAKSETNKTEHKQRHPLLGGCLFYARKEAGE